MPLHTPARARAPSLGSHRSMIACSCRANCSCCSGLMPSSAGARQTAERGSMQDCMPLQSQRRLRMAAAKTDKLRALGSTIKVAESRHLGRDTRRSSWRRPARPSPDPTCWRTAGASSRSGVVHLARRRKQPCCMQQWARSGASDASVPTVAPRPQLTMWSSKPARPARVRCAARLRGSPTMSNASSPRYREVFVLNFTRGRPPF